MKRVYSILITIVFGALSLNAQYFSEDFEGGLPTGWTLEGNMAVTDATTISSAYFAPAEHTQFVGTNDDGLGQGADGSGAVISDKIDLTMVTGALVLTFDSYFINGDYQGADETAKVYASTDAGATWTEVFDETGGQWNRTGGLFDYAGQEVWVKFEYTDGNAWNYGWCIDNIAIEEAPAREVAFEYWNSEEFFTGGFEGGTVIPGGVIKNNGTEILTSVDLTWSDGTNSSTETISGINLAFGESMMVEAPTAYVIPAGNSTISIAVGNANGMGDDEDPSNDAGNDLSISTVTPNADRGVLVEEGTGTWCPWCTRGTVFMDGLSRRYPNKFVGVAVHNADPMTVAAYDSGIGSLIGGYPGSVVERGADTDPSALEAPFVSAVQQAPPARLMVGAELDGQSLTVSVSGEFLQDIPGGYKFAAILIENGVTGTSSGYAQANAYGGGSNGPMGGYELLGGSIPATDMVYEHVGRMLIGGFNGDAQSLPDGAGTGEILGYTFPTAIVSAGVNMDNVYIAGVLLNASNRPVNAVQVSLDDAIADGIFVSTNDVFNHNSVSVFPNPITDIANINITMESSADVTVQIFNSVGQSVFARDYGTMTGNQNITFDAANLNSGVYFVHVRMGDELATKRVTITK